MTFSEETTVEKPAIKMFRNLGYEYCDLFNEELGSENKLGRETSSDVVLRRILKKKLFELNPDCQKESVDLAIEELVKDRRSMNIVQANKDVYDLIRNGVKVKVLDANRDEIAEIIKVVDWANPEKNDFFVGTQMWISGEIHNRRPDFIGFVNGLPLILGEVKKISINVKHAYDDNLSDYLDTIPHLFWYNAFVILSNGKDSKIGTFNAPWEHFNDWKKISEEENGIVSLDTIIRGTCEKNRLLDIIENFTLFSETQGKLIKVIAKNHQFLGVNKAIRAFIEAKKRRDGKIGVFWHTTGSGKSYSMIFFSNKILRKEYGNYTFLIITDRIDLDDQIYKNFEKTGSVTETNIRAEDCGDLKKLLKEDHRHIFTLIQKFQPERKEIEKGGKKATIKEAFPVLSERSDIIILCDEAHRTQYGELATNMRTALPNALFIAFTATPLFEDEQITMQIFGDYVSIYNFKQSVEDKATVPLYYVNRKPEVEVIDKNLNPKILRLIEDASLDEDQVEKLREKYPKEFQVIENETRLDIVAKDIVDHFVGRGYKGKAMVVSIDRFTAVKMYNKIQQFWKRKIEEIEEELKHANNFQKTPLEVQIKFMKETDMAVVVSNSQNEIKKFKEKGLDITPHRKRIVTEDLDVKFKEPTDPLRLVFVCAMWMTGFDAPPVSTIYLDKPIRNHTLMQTISRANRVFGDKQSGTIVDYYGILRNLNKALAIYGSGGQTQKGNMPLRNVDELASILESNLKTMEKYFLDKGIRPSDILQAKDFTRIQLLEQAVEVAEENDQSRILFLSLLRLVVNSYTDLLPDTKANRFKHLIELYVVIGETIASNSPEIDISDIEKRIGDLIDRSIAVKPYLPKNAHEEIDLSKIDLPQIKASYKKGQKRTEAEKLRSIVNRKLSELLQVNRLRIDFQERLEKIVKDYNSGSTNIEQYFKQLTKFFKDLQDEEKRHIAEGLTEEELAVFDLLKKASPKISRKEEQQVKTIAKELLEKLKEQKLVLDWKKKTRTRADVQRTIENTLIDKLPEPPYTSQIKQEKAVLLYQHIYDSYQGAGQSNYA